MVSELSEFNMKRFELEGIQRSIEEQEVIISLLIDQVARSYAEELRRVTDDSPTSSCTSASQCGTERNLSISTDDWCGLSDCNMSVVSEEISKDMRHYPGHFEAVKSRGDRRKLRSNKVFGRKKGNLFA